MAGSNFSNTKSWEKHRLILSSQSLSDLDQTTWSIPHGPATTYQQIRATTANVNQRPQDCVDYTDGSSLGTTTHPVNAG